MDENRRHPLTEVCYCTSCFDRREADRSIKKAIDADLDRLQAESLAALRHQAVTLVDMTALMTRLERLREAQRCHVSMTVSVSYHIHVPEAVIEYEVYVANHEPSFHSGVTLEAAMAQAELAAGLEKPERPDTLVLP